MNCKIFIGVAWPYANGSLHLGHIAGCYLPADIFARYHRLIGNDVLMVSGSDEHGTPITITAEKEKTTPQAIVNRYNTEHTKNMKQFGISFDLFTRTTTKNHEAVVQDIFSTLYTKKFVYKKSIEAFFCKNCQRFLPDRYLEGTCPYCEYEKARGDQCDNCGKLLDTSELAQVRCKLCGGTPAQESTDHLFFALSQFESKLVQWLKDKEHWKANVLKFTNNWLKDGLQDRAVTRDLTWGVPVPVPGFENKRIYVWFDAVIGYFAASKEWAQSKNTPCKWEEWWKNKDAQHYYFLAKDNIPFHSIIWPSILMGYDESLDLPHDIPANEYLLLKGEQFSKSRAVAVWVPDILEKFDADAVRYYLSINMPENKDSNWLWHDFIAKNNDELVGTYGNFIHRVVTFTSKNFGKIPPLGRLEQMDSEVFQKITDTGVDVGEAIAQCSFKKGLRAVMNLAQFGNYYFDQTQPWNLVKNDEKRCRTVLHVCLRLVQALAVYMAPYLPFSSQRVWKMLGKNKEIHSWDEAQLDLAEGTVLERPSPLFKKLDLEDIMEERDPFSKLDLRVAKIIDIKDIPQADKLYLLRLDLGPLGKRIIVAGMKPFYSKEEMLGRSIVIVSNLKPATIRGVTSRGMLLAAEDKTTCSLLDPKDASPGSEVFVEGVPREPVAMVEFEEFSQVDLIVGDNQEAWYAGKPLRSQTSVVVTDKKISKGRKIK